MLKFTIATLLSVLSTATLVLAQSTEAPALKESRELNSKVIKLYSEAKYDEALLVAKRALELRQTALGATNEGLIPLLTNLGEIYRAKKKPGDARTYFKRALEIAETSFSQDDLRIADLLDKLGLMAHEDREPRDAERLFARSLAIKGKVLGEDNIEVAGTLANLAENYRQLGEYDKAEALFKRLVGLRERAPGKNNADLQRAIEGYVMTLLAQKKVAEADAAQEKLKLLLSSQEMMNLGVLNSKALKLVQPAYPIMAREGRAQGIVRVRIVIDENGKVISAETIDRGTVHPALARAAEEAARQSRFTPTFFSGAAVRVSGTIIYRFVAR